jgi:hypothetical protein
MGDFFGKERQMLCDIRTWRDEDFGTVGLALRVRCQWTGCLIWLWSPESVEFKDQPSVSAYQVESVATEVIDWELSRTLPRLAKAGVITPAEGQLIWARLYGEMRDVKRYWDARGERVPTIEEAMRAEDQQ